MPIPPLGFFGSFKKSQVLESWARALTDKSTTRINYDLSEVQTRFFDLFTTNDVLAMRGFRAAFDKAWKVKPPLSPIYMTDHEELFYDCFKDQSDVKNGDKIRNKAPIEEFSITQLKEAYKGIHRDLLPLAVGLCNSIGEFRSREKIPEDHSVALYLTFIKRKIISIFKNVGQGNFLSIQAGLEELKTFTDEIDRLHVLEIPGWFSLNTKQVSKFNMNQSGAIEIEKNQAPGILQVQLVITDTIRDAIGLSTAKVAQINVSDVFTSLSDEFATLAEVEYDELLKYLWLIGSNEPYPRITRLLSGSRIQDTANQVLGYGVKTLEGSQFKALLPPLHTSSQVVVNQHYSSAPTKKAFHSYFKKALSGFTERPVETLAHKFIEYSIMYSGLLRLRENTEEIQDIIKLIGVLGAYVFIQPKLLTYLETTALVLEAVIAKANEFIAEHDAIMKAATALGHEGAGRLADLRKEVETQRDRHQSMLQQTQLGITHLKAVTKATIDRHIANTADRIKQLSKRIPAQSDEMLKLADAVKHPVSPELRAKVKTQQLEILTQPSLEKTFSVSSSSTTSSSQTSVAATPVPPVSAPPVTNDNDDKKALAALEKQLHDAENRYKALLVKLSPTGDDRKLNQDIQKAQSEFKEFNAELVDLRNAYKIHIQRIKDLELEGQVKDSQISVLELTEFQSKTLNQNIMQKYQSINYALQAVFSQQLNQPDKNPVGMLEKKMDAAKQGADNFRLILDRMNDYVQAFARANPSSGLGSKQKGIKEFQQLAQSWSNEDTLQKDINLFAQVMKNVLGDPNKTVQDVRDAYEAIIRSMLTRLSKLEVLQEKQQSNYGLNTRKGYLSAYYNDLLTMLMSTPKDSIPALQFLIPADQVIANIEAKKLTSKEVKSFIDDVRGDHGNQSFVHDQSEEVSEFDVDYTSGSDDDEPVLRGSQKPQNKTT